MGHKYYYFVAHRTVCKKQSAYDNKNKRYDFFLLSFEVLMTVNIRPQSSGMWSHIVWWVTQQWMVGWIRKGVEVATDNFKVCN
jgi:hypothetical protein